MEVNLPVSNINKNWIRGLDSMRFVLAFIVMLGHIVPGYATKNPNHPFLNLIHQVSSMMFCGPAAVISFFIISGFVIHFPNRNKTTIKVIPYLIRRAVRIGIPLIAVLLIGTHFNLMAHVPVWSLYCELIYYVIYPVLFYSRISWNKLFIFTFILALVVVSILNFDCIRSALHQKDLNYQPDYWINGTFITALIGLPCWLLGATLASKIDNLNYNVGYQTLLFYRIAVYIFSCIILVVNFHFYIGYIFTLNFFALLAVKWLEKEIVYYKQRLPLKVLEYLGKFSYSLYLWHGILYVFLGTFIVQNLYTLPVGICLIIIGAYIAYLLLEYPSHKIAQYLATLVIFSK